MNIFEQLLQDLEDAAERYHLFSGDFNRLHALAFLAGERLQFLQLQCESEELPDDVIQQRKAIGKLKAKARLSTMNILGTEEDMDDTIGDNELLARLLSQYLGIQSIEYLEDTEFDLSDYDF